MNSAQSFQVRIWLVFSFFIYHRFEEHDDLPYTFFKAFDVSDGTVEVRGGLGHN